MIASRTQSKCDAIVKAIGNPNIKTAKVDADNVDELVALFNGFKPEIVINVALPYQDLSIMEACLKAGVNYLDTANYEPKDVAHFEYSWQWAYKKTFRGCRVDRYLRLRLRSGGKRYIHGIRSQASFRRNPVLGYRRLQCGQPS